MGEQKTTNFHKTTISKMMKSLAILAASLAAVQAQQGLGRLLNGEEGVLNNNFSEADFEHCMDHQDDDWCVEQCENREIARMYPEMCGRHLEDREDGIADGGMSEEDCDENSRECGRHLADKDDRYALNNFFRLLDPWNDGEIGRREMERAFEDSEAFGKSEDKWDVIGQFFRDFDTNNDQVIEKKEFMLVLKKLLYEPHNNRRMLSDGDTYEKNGQTCWLKGNGNEKCCDPDKYWKKNGNHRCRR